MGPSFNDDNKSDNMGWTISAQNAYENTIEKLLGIYKQIIRIDQYTIK